MHAIACRARFVTEEQQCLLHSNLQISFSSTIITDITQAFMLGGEGCSIAEHWPDYLARQALE